jgi:hypothetical protein
MTRQQFWHLLVEDRTMDKPKRKAKPHYDFYFNAPTFFRRFGVAICVFIAYVVICIALSYPAAKHHISINFMNQMALAMWILGGCFIPFVMLALFSRMIVVAQRREFQSLWSSAIFVVIHLALLVCGMFLIGAVIVVNLVGFQISFEKTVVVNDREYRLAKLYYDDYLSDALYLVYECDSAGTDCQLIYETSYRYKSASIEVDEAHQQLILDFGNDHSDVIDVSNPED